MSTSPARLQPFSVDQWLAWKYAPSSLRRHSCTAMSAQIEDDVAELLRQTKLPTPTYGLERQARL